ncbi:hypothetical protein skT53_09560 [Effusibacillus dendaii]|uniref:LysR substrate-binding domain-containing protein n=1 Tax=Effusibacillus dendaii TaxID=2743772 RepID=A0A7I8DDK2_9BACL|nr:hypothetical protein skT53_09560 [Effusibacillus dendaii]
MASKTLVVEELQIITATGRSPDDALQENPVAITFREGCTYRRVLERWATGRGFTLLKTMECASIDTILQLVAGGLEISMMPKAIIEQSKWSHQLAAHPVDDNKGLVTTHAVWRHAAHLPRPLSALLAQLSE